MEVLALPGHVREQIGLGEAGLEARQTEADADGRLEAQGQELYINYLKEL